MNELKGKGLFVFSDPAGAKAVLALVYLLKRDNIITDFKVISDRKYSFFEDFEIEVNTHYQQVVG